MPEELELLAAPGGTRLRLRVKPGAKRSVIVGVHGGALKVAVAAPPEKGKANRAVLKVLAEALGLPLASVSLLSGDASQDKVALVALAPSLVRERLTPRSPRLD